MPISSITTTDTFGLLVTRTSQLITAYNTLESNGAISSAVSAQTAFGAANSAFANGNTNFVVLQSAFGTANSGWLQANTARSHANAAFANANTTHTLTIDAFTQANTARDQANTAVAAAGPGFNAANAAFLQANTARTHANTAFAAANASFANGNTNFAVTVAAFAKANAALPNTTTTLAGTLTVTGDIIGKIASNTNTTVIRISTGTEFRAGTSRSTALAPADVFDAAAEVSVADGTTITIDMSTGFNFNVNLTARATRSIATPTNMKPGQSGYIRIKQGAATAQTASYGSGWAFSGGVPPVFSTGTGNTDILFFQVLSTANVFGSLSKDLRLNY
jgi:hypothetical protein